MAANEIHFNDIGTIFELTVTDGSALDISDATSKQIILYTADNRRLVKSASFSASSGADGKLRYSTVNGDLTPAGIFKIQAVYTGSAGTWHSDITTFTVHPNI